MTPTISIIVPVYNVEDYISKCISSILKQTFSDFELIIVNDGSTDNSLLICEEFAVSDKRIILINKNNNGVSSARNAGLDIVKGKYITFIDGDDFVEPNYLEKMYYLLKNAPSSDYVICNFKRVDPFGIQVGEPLPVYATKHIDIIDSIECYKYTSGLVWGALYKKEALMINNKMLKFAANIHNGEDNLYTFLIFVNSNRFIRTTDVLYNYLVRSDSAFHKSFSEKNISFLDAQSIMIKNSKRFPVIKKYLYDYYISNCIQYMERAIESNLLSRDINKIRVHLIKNFFKYFFQHRNFKQIAYYIKLIIAPKYNK